MACPPAAIVRLAPAASKPRGERIWRGRPLAINAERVAAGDTAHRDWRNPCLSTAAKNPRQPANTAAGEHGAPLCPAPATLTHPSKIRGPIGSHATFAAETTAAAPRTSRTPQAGDPVLKFKPRPNLAICTAAAPSSTLSSSARNESRASRAAFTFAATAVRAGRAGRPVR